MLFHAADASFFLAKMLGTQLYAPFSIPPLNSLHFLYMYFLDPFPRPDSPHMHVGAFPLSTTLLTLLDSTLPCWACTIGILIHSSKYMARTVVWANGWILWFGIPYFFFFLLVWFLIFVILFGLRECFPFWFLFFYFYFWRFFLVSGSALGHIALLEGVCWNYTVRGQGQAWLALGPTQPDPTLSESMYRV